MTSTVPTPCAGDTAVIDVGPFTKNDVAAVPPNDTAVAPVNPVPVIVTEVPPAVGPLVGFTPLTEGGATKLNWSAPVTALVPFGPVTVMSTVPAPCAGDVAVIDVGPFTTNVVAAVPPKDTAVAPVNPAPKIVTDVPPAVGPLPGLTADTDGGPMKVN
jgi:hypothetical protein